MEDSHRIKIQRNLIALSKGVNLERLYPLLIEEGIILRDDVESLQVRKFNLIIYTAYDILQKVGLQ